MSRRVRRKISEKGKEKIDFPEIEKDLILEENEVVDWTKLSNDIVIQLFSSLNYRDRASLSSTCHSWWAVSKSPFLWADLDLRAHKCDVSSASLLASRCENLQKLHFRNPESLHAIVNLRAKNLRSIIGDGCKKITDATLSVLVGRHESLECLVIGPDFCEKISSDAIISIAICCPKLQKLHLSGIHDVNANAINALAKHCKNLKDIGFIDCRKVDEIALGKFESLRFLSIAGTSIKWDIVVLHWNNLPNLIALDVSRTNISPIFVSNIFSTFSSLKVLCALNCPSLENDATFVSNNHNGKVLLAVFTHILKGIESLFVDIPNDDGNGNVFLDWRNNEMKYEKFNEMLNWLEWIISNSLLRISESSPPGLGDFWLNQGANLLFTFMQSSKEEIQERAVTALATLVIIDDVNVNIDTGRAETIMRDGRITLLLKLARSWREGLQSEAAKAIANLSLNANVAKDIAENGGISILVDLSRSVNRSVSEEATGGLWNLSFGQDHKRAITEAGGVKVLIDLVLKWSESNGGNKVLERAVGTLANLSADDKCSLEVASQGGVHALVTLARSFKVDGVQEQAAQALANLAASNTNNAVVGQEFGALEALVQLTNSHHDGVKQEAAGALWNLSFDDRNREAIVAAGGVESLVALANSCTNASPGLQERAAGSLWALSISETNSIAIGREGGVAPLISLARSDVEDVHETAAGALWNLAFNPDNALRIVEEGGVQILAHLCSTSLSRMARFMSALTLAYIFDGRMDENALVGTSAEGISKGVQINVLRKMAFTSIEAFIMMFFDPQAIAAAASSMAPTALAQVTETACILEVGHIRCSGAEIGRFVTMLKNPSPTLKSCAAFALLQFTVPDGRHAMIHVKFLENAGARRILRAAAAAASAPRQAKIFARIVLRNVEQHQISAHCSIV